jgi:hypothetical protein
MCVRMCACEECVYVREKDEGGGEGDGRWGREKESEW